MEPLLRDFYGDYYKVLRNGNSLHNYLGDNTNAFVNRGRMLKFMHESDALLFMESITSSDHELFDILSKSPKLISARFDSPKKQFATLLAQNFVRLLKFDRASVRPSTLMAGSADQYRMFSHSTEVKAKSKNLSYFFVELHVLLDAKHVATKKFLGLKEIETFIANLNVSREQLLTITRELRVFRPSFNSLSVLELHQELARAINSYDIAVIEKPRINNSLRASVIEPPEPLGFLELDPHTNSKQVCTPICKCLENFWVGNNGRYIYADNGNSWGNTLYVVAEFTEDNRLYKPLEIMRAGMEACVDGKTNKAKSLINNKPQEGYDYKLFSSKDMGYFDSVTFIQLVRNIFKFFSDGELNAEGKACYSIPVCYTPENLHYSTLNVHAYEPVKITGECKADLSVTIATTGITAGLKLDGGVTVTLGRSNFEIKKPLQKEDGTLPEDDVGDDSLEIIEQLQDILSQSEEAKKNSDNDLDFTAATSSLTLSSSFSIIPGEITLVEDMTSPDLLLKGTFVLDADPLFKITGSLDVLDILVTKFGGPLAKKIRDARIKLASGEDNSAEVYANFEFSGEVTYRTERDLGQIRISPRTVAPSKARAQFEQITQGRIGAVGKIGASIKLKSWLFEWNASVEGNIHTAISVSIKTFDREKYEKKADFEGIYATFKAEVTGTIGGSGGIKKKQRPEPTNDNSSTTVSTDVLKAEGAKELVAPIEGNWSELKIFSSECA